MCRSRAAEHRKHRALNDAAGKTDIHRVHIGPLDKFGTYRLADRQKCRRCDEDVDAARPGRKRVEEAIDVGFAGHVQCVSSASRSLRSLLRFIGRAVDHDGMRGATNASAVARPMPRAPPVMTATCPSSENGRVCWARVVLPVRLLAFPATLSESVARASSVSNEGFRQPAPSVLKSIMGSTRSTRHETPPVSSLRTAAAAAPPFARAPARLDYPARPVRVIVTYAPGGQTDVAARLICGKISEQLAGNFYVENIVGGAGNAGMDRPPAPHPTATRCWPPSAPRHQPGPVRAIPYDPSMISIRCRLPSPRPWVRGQ